MYPFYPHGFTFPDTLIFSIRFRTAFRVTNNSPFLLFGTASNEPAKHAVFIVFTYHMVVIPSLSNNNIIGKLWDAAY